MTLDEIFKLLSPGETITLKIKKYESGSGDVFMSTEKHDQQLTIEEKKSINNLDRRIRRILGGVWVDKKEVIASNQTAIPMPDDNIKDVAKEVLKEQDLIKLGKMTVEMPVLIPEKLKDEVKKTNKKKEPAADFKKKSKALIGIGSNFFKGKQYDYARDYFKQALMLDPTNKHLPADIKKCEQWIVALEQLNKEEAKVEIDTFDPTESKEEKTEPEIVDDLDFNIPTL